jgi:precorrin-6Y C5,15-methyltransferase (decarboxylating)
VVGITDAGAASLSQEALALVEGAKLLCGGQRNLAFFPDHPAERLAIGANVEEVFRRLQGESQPTVVLASGDPACYGIGPLLADRLGRDRVRIIPNVSAVQLAFARLGIGWQDAALLSAHGRPLDSILPGALLARKAAILTDERNSPGAIARALMDAGDEDALLDIFEHLGGPAERHVSGRVADLVDATFAPLNLMVVRRPGPPRPWPLGLPEEAFAHGRGLITKAEVRAVSLARLRLHVGAVIWDVGAGCGSVSIEAAALVQPGRVYAVERDPRQLEYLVENRRRFGAGNVCVVPGEAPSALAELPVPDAVFVGGSGGQLTAVLEGAADRIAAGGRIVANLATLEHLAEALTLGRKRAWETEIVQMSVARSAHVADLTRLEGLNPVFVVTLSGFGRESEA